jgi:S-formylglutathione hydrolase FrmB
LTAVAPAPRASGPTHGVVVAAEIPPTVSGFRARDAFVWLPPAYFASDRPRLPVVEMLAGVPGDPSNLLRAADAGGIADRYAAAHDGVAPILVFADQNGTFFGDTECVDGPRGNAETYLTVDVPAYLARRFDADVAPGHVGVIGYSEGGTCAVTLALRHPSEFDAFVDIAGDDHPNAASGRNEMLRTSRRLYRGSIAEYEAHDPARLLNAPHGALPHAYFVAGTADARARIVAARLAALTRSAGEPTVVDILPGGHNFRLVRGALEATFAPLADDVLRDADSSGAV